MVPVFRSKYAQNARVLKTRQTFPQFQFATNNGAIYQPKDSQALRKVYRNSLEVFRVLN
jgi:hypothetical protein